MAESHPNILLITTDQQRGDCLGIENHPVLDTPYLDQIAAQGVRFSRAYSACPVCVPARRTLMTGAKAASHGVTMNYDTHLTLPTLPETLSKAGYQTHLAGKLHLYPARKMYGFHSADWADTPGQTTLGQINNDYQRFLADHGRQSPDLSLAHGVHGNGWISRPWHMEERFHFTNWAVDGALRYLERRDPTVPFFLNLSIFAPHQPFTPPAYYFDKYMALDLPDPVVGDWARVYETPQRGHEINAWRVSLTPRAQREMMAGYFGSIEHADHQIGRVLKHLPENTVVLFASDHGEMLGDHQWIRKRVPYEASARVPFLLRLPKVFGVSGGQVRRELVELMDIMPSLLDAAGVAIPDTVDGQSVLPLLRGEASGWREHLHGECAVIDTMNSGMQFIVTGDLKYVRYPGTGLEEAFDLVADPHERVNLIGDPAQDARIAPLRQILIEELAGRSEGFVRDGQLAVTGGPAPSFLPGFQRTGPSGPALLNGVR